MILNDMKYLQFNRINFKNSVIFKYLVFFITNSMLLEKKYKYFLIFIKFFYSLSRKFINIYKKNNNFLLNYIYLYT